MLRIGLPDAEVARIEHALFFEPPYQRSRIIRFFTLLLFGTTIAGSGLMADSLASILGSGFIAPLMTPIMGMVVAIVMGQPQRLLRSFIYLVLGCMMAVTVGFLLARLMPNAWDPLNSAQILARTEPRMLNVLVALAAGGAGAYALSRSDIADALPGAIISLSLVPPLVTVGILLSLDRPEQALGAFELFLMDFGCILLAGTVTFVVTGLAASAGRRLPQLAGALILITLIAGALIIPLRSNSQSLWTQAERESEALSAVQLWLDGSETDVVRVQIDGAEIAVFLSGDGNLPVVDPLLADLRAIVPYAVVTVRNTLVQRSIYPATPVGE